jgi:hypothetical protein
MRKYVIGGVLLAAAMAVLVLTAMRESAGKTANATGTVTAITFDPGDDNTTSRTLVRYRFEAGGQALESEQTFDRDPRDRLREGQTVNICYNPERPASSNIAPDGYDCSG